MAKRSIRTGQTVRHSSASEVETVLTGGRGGWHPILVERHDDEDREQSYRRKVRPQSENQKALMQAIDTHHLTVALGPAGTGKTYLAVTAAVEALEEGNIDRIVLSRPAVEAGENLGFLPGDLHEKLAPYLRPLYDALNERIGGKRVRQLIAEGTIEIAPIAYMRGRTLNNAFVVIDEAQNCTYGQIKMLLTRLGWHSTMVLTGVAVVRLTDADIVRHPLVADMLTVL
jgi:phosphate starvation-inducible PhoH-like protein